MGYLLSYRFVGVISIRWLYANGVIAVIFVVIMLFIEWLSRCGFGVLCVGFSFSVSIMLVLCRAKSSMFLMSFLFFLVL